MRPTRSPRPARVLAGVIALAALLVAGCGDSDDEGGDATTTTAPDTTPATDPTTTVVANSTTTTLGPPTDDVLKAWAATAAEHRGQNGETFDYDCPAGGTSQSIWGTEVYTDDSSVCTAGVHVGLIDFVDGGTVTIEISDGQGLYMGTTGNALLSSDFGPFEGSFQFPDAPPDSGEFTVGQESWARTASSFSGAIGDTFTIPCSANGTTGSVWGTGTYTADSSVCSAAVHDGLITVAEGGSVTYDIVTGLEAYIGTTANGVTSSGYGPYATVFVFSAEQGAEGG